MATAENSTTNPVITVIERTAQFTRYRIVGEPSPQATDWIEKRRSDREPWCEITVCRGYDYISSFGG